MKYVGLHVFNEYTQDHLEYEDVEGETIEDALQLFAINHGLNPDEEDSQWEDISNEAGVEGRVIISEDEWIVAETKNNCRIIYAVIQERN